LIPEEEEDEDSSYSLGESQKEWAYDAKEKKMLDTIVILHNKNEELANKASLLKQREKAIEQQELELERFKTKLKRKEAKLKRRESAEKTVAKATLEKEWKVSNPWLPLPPPPKLQQFF